MRTEFFTAFENAAWPVLWLDGAGTVLRANGAAVNLLGPAAASGSARLTAFWAPDNPVSADGFFLQWTRAPLPSVPVSLRVRGGQSVRTQAWILSWSRDQERFFLLQLLPGPTGEVAGGENAQARLEGVLRFARTLALDFNNALTAILARTSLLLSRLQEEHPCRTELLEIEQAAARAAELAHELGSYGRVSPDSHARAPGSIQELVQQAIEIVRRKPYPASIDWVVELQRPLYLVRFQEARLLQALVHVLENAVESLEVAGRVTVRARNLELAVPTRDRNVEVAAGSHVCIEVTDTGQGIPPEILPRVFEPFFTTKADRGHRGLGLAWVYGVVTSHGGGVALSSEPGRGTSVRIYLPAEPVVGRDPGPPPEQLRGHGTVLVVDDDERVLRIMETVLQQFGFGVLTASSGPEALSLLETRNEPPDVAVVDLIMPRMSGREVIEKLQKLRPGLPVVSTTGYVWPEPDRRRQALHLRKPFTARELVWRIQEALRNPAPSSIGGATGTDPGAPGVS